MNTTTASTDPYTIPRNFRGTSVPDTATPAVAGDPITEITQIIRTLVFYYTENITQHNRVIETYNQNVTTLLTLLNNILEHHTLRNRQQNTDYRDFNYYYRNLFQPRRGGTISRNRGASLDLSNLVYLLNLPIQVGVNGGAAVATERPTPLTLTEIAHATRIIYYDESMGERRCPISLDDFIPNEQVCQIRGCRHYFKPQHLLRWLESHVECPVCRYDLRQYRTSTSTTNSTAAGQEIAELRDNLDQPDTNQGTTNITENSQPIRRNVSVSEFLPILENILSSPSSTNDIPILSDSSTNLLTNRFSQVLTDLILDQIPSIDSSNNLLYTIEIPLTR